MDVDVEPNFQVENLVDESVVEEKPVEEIQVAEPLEDGFGSNLERFSVSAEEIKENEDVDFNASQTEVLTDFSKLGSIAEEIEQEEQKLAEKAEEESQETIEVENDDLTEDETEESAETEDVEVGGYQKIEELDGILIVTADHGNCDYMIDDNGEVITSHSTSLVPFIISSRWTYNIR